MPSAKRATSSLTPDGDWARWAAAAESACGWSDGDALRAYKTNRQVAIETTLEGDPVATAIRALSLPWTGTASDLLTQVTPTDRRLIRGWPESPRGLSAALARLAPQLRRVGLVIRNKREPHTGRRLITIDSGAKDRPSPSSPLSPAPFSLADRGDDRLDRDHVTVTRPSPNCGSASTLGDDGDDRVLRALEEDGHLDGDVI
jgi:hypothetical protein